MWYILKRTLFLIICFFSLKVRAEDIPVLYNFDTITVTATKTAKKIEEIPSSISSINQAEIDKRQANSIDDLLKDIPNLEQSGGPRRSAETPNIRGLGESRTIVKINGARQNLIAGHNGRFFIDPYFLSNIDILRGPQSSLYGSGAIGGVITMHTLQATDLLEEDKKWGGFVKAGYQSAQKEFAKNIAFYTQPSASYNAIGQILFRNSKPIRKSDKTKLSYSQDDIQSFYLQNNIDFNDHHHFDISHIQYVNHHPTLSAPNLEKKEVALSRFDKAQVKLDGDVITPLKRKTRQLTTTGHYIFSNPSYAWGHLDVHLYTNEIKHNDKAYLVKRQDKTFFQTNGGEVYNVTTLSLNKNIHTIFTSGYELYRDHQKGRRNDKERLQFPDASMNNQAFYLQDEWNIGNKVYFTPAIRYDVFHAQSKSDLKDKKDNRFSPKINLAFKPISSTQIYYQYATAFRSPNLSELYGQGVHIPPLRRKAKPNLFIPNPDLKSEKAKNKEIGINYHSKNILQENDKFFTKLTYFNNRIRDFIQIIPNFHPKINKTFIKNISSAKIYGFENENCYENLYFFSGLTFSTIFGKDRLTNEYLGTIPSHKVILNNGLYSFNQSLLIGWRAHFHKKQTKIPRKQTTRHPIKKTPGYGVHDLYCTYLPSSQTFKNLKLHFGIDNIFNKKYRKHLSFVEEMERNYKITLSYSL